jgi:hypothetical protein
MGGLGSNRNEAAILAFSVLGFRLEFECADATLTELVVADSPGLPCNTDGRAQGSAVRYSVTGHAPSFALCRRGKPALVGRGGAAFLSLLERDLTVELQRRRPDLLFVHSAALAWQGRAFLLVAESGVGKSTTAWGLLNRGCGYLSDELAPIDLASLHVHPYPRALCLKEVPRGYPPPAAAVDLGVTTHIPPSSLPGGPVYEPKPLSAIFLLRRMRVFGAPEIRALAPAETAARLYVHVLNALAHRNRGLDAVTEIARQVPGFAVALADLPASCALIQAAVAATLAATPSEPDFARSKRPRRVKPDFARAKRS